MFFPRISKKIPDTDSITVQNFQVDESWKIIAHVREIGTLERAWIKSPQSVLGLNRRISWVSLRPLNPLARTRRTWSTPGYAHLCITIYTYTYWHIHLATPRCAFRVRVPPGCHCSGFIHERYPRIWRSTPRHYLSCMCQCAGIYGCQAWFWVCEYVMCVGSKHTHIGEDTLDMCISALQNVRVYVKLQFCWLCYCCLLNALMKKWLHTAKKTPW